MDTYSFVLIGVGVLIFVGLLIQFRLTSKKGILFGIAAAGAVVGGAWLVGARQRKLLAELKDKEKELSKQEDELKELEKQYKISKEEIAAAKKVFEQDRIDYKRAILRIEAEKERRVEEIDRMSPQDVLKAFAKKYGDQ